MSRTTFQDAVVHIVDYLGGNPTDQVQRDAKRAVLEAYRDLANAHRWTYLVRHGRIITNAATDGDPGAAITYVQSTRTVTLAGWTWPAWAASGYLRVGDATYRVRSRTDDTHLVLDDEVNFGADVTDPVAFKLYQDTYLLPPDYIGNDQTMYENNFSDMGFVKPAEWLFENRYIYSEGTPRCYTITGDLQYPGRLVMRVFPFPDASRTIDFVYHRRPRPLEVTLRDVGKAAITQGSTTVTLAALMASPTMVGQVIRVSGLASKAPTSAIGDNPAVLEGTILAAPTGTTLVLDTPAPATLSGMPLAISDPIDLEDGAMLNAFWRCCEMHVSLGRTLRDKPSSMPLYKAALVEAKQADSRSFAGRAVGDQGRIRQRLRDMPINLTETE